MGPLSELHQLKAGTLPGFGFAPVLHSDALLIPFRIPRICREGTEGLPLDERKGSRFLREEVIHPPEIAVPTVESAIKIRVPTARESIGLSYMCLPQGVVRDDVNPMVPR